MSCYKLRCDWIDKLLHLSTGFDEKSTLKKN
jgi:hypothetical protein